MTLFFKSFFTYTSKRLTASVFESMCKGGKVLEQNEQGAKVVRLADGNIIKVFRVKRLISGARIFSYARRFCRNAIRLKEKGIPTVTIKELYHFSDNSNTAALYKPIAGETLRDIVKRKEMSADLIKALAIFLSDLHNKGIHFHSLHTGNVVLTPTGELGLIDISDLTIHPWPLFYNTRIRSFKRLCKYSEDIKEFGEDYWQKFQDIYFAESRLSLIFENRIKRANKQLIRFEHDNKACQTKAHTF